MNAVIFSSITRLVVLLSLQILVFKGISLGGVWMKYIQVFIYPIFLMSLPLRTSATLQVILGFAVGLIVDIFYDSLGVHAGTGALMGFIRPLLLRILEPQTGYNVNFSPNAHFLGTNWFLSYAAIFLVIFLFTLFSLDAFSLVYIQDISLKTLTTFIFSYIFVVLHQMIFRPTD
jgi:hypothetical protein